MPRPGRTLLRSGGFRLTILCHALALCHSSLAKPSRGLGPGGICVPLLCYTVYTDLWLAGLLSAEPPGCVRYRERSALGLSHYEGSYRIQVERKVAC